MMDPFVIYVVEDEFVFAMLFEQVLGQLPNVAVTCFSTMDEMLEQTAEPSLLILDYQQETHQTLDRLPEVSARFPKAPVVMVSGQLDVAVVAQAYRSGVAKYYRKDQSLMENLRDHVTQLQQSGTQVQRGGQPLRSFLGVSQSKIAVKTAFIVEDDRVTGHLLEDVVKTCGAPTVYRFETGAECVKALSLSPELVLLDFMLPDMDGGRVLAAIRAELPRTKVVVISGQDDIAVAIGLFEQGILDYIVKQGEWRHELSELLQRVTA